LFFFVLSFFYIRLEYVQVGDKTEHEIDGEYVEIKPDTIEREKIFAFPPTRKSFIHNHITYETNYEKYLPKYLVPTEVQVLYF
jgi:hypothetical protein